MKKTFCLLALSIFAIQPVMADNHKSDVKEHANEKVQNLNAKQEKALDMYRQSMKADRENMKKDQETHKTEMIANQAKKKEAFIEGKFENINDIQENMIEKRMKNKEKMAETKAENLKKAFGDLTKEERAGVVDMVFKDHTQMSVAKDNMKKRKGKK